MKIKLLILFNELGYGGVETKIVDIIRYIYLHYPKIQVTLCLRKKRGHLLKKIPNNTIILSPNVNKKSFDIIRFFIFSCQKLKQIRPDVILTFVDTTSTIASLAKIRTNLKNCHHIISEDINTQAYIRSKKHPLIHKLCIKYLYPFASKILVLNQSNKKFLTKFLGKKNKEKIITTPNWLPLPYQHPKIIHKKRDIDILNIGRLCQQKNIPKFFKITQATNFKASFVSSTPNPKKFYRRSKILLITSRFEGFPLTILEAISSGCLPVVNNLPEFSDFFKKYKKLIVYNNNQEAVEKISYLIHNYHTRQKVLKYYQNKVFSEQIPLIKKTIHEIIT
jgi:glycosyltransferase involved in cell wall biosynthesis